MSVLWQNCRVQNAERMRRMIGGDDRNTKEKTQLLIVTRSRAMIVGVSEWVGGVEEMKRILGVLATTMRSQR